VYTVGRGLSGGTNRLLDALPAADNERLVRSLNRVFLDVKTVLFEPDRPIAAVYFPLKRGDLPGHAAQG
jgi:hypothetical protein